MRNTPERPMTPRERAEIAASVRYAWTALALKRAGFTKLHQRNAAQYPLPDLEQDCALATVKCNHTLTDPHTRAQVLTALDRNDLEFFRRLGRVLTGEPNIPQATALEKFLLDHWAERKDGLPELCILRPSGLLAVCQNRLRNTNLTEAAVTKERERLLLKPFKRGKISAFYIDGTLHFRDRQGRRLFFETAPLALATKAPKAPAQRQRPPNPSPYMERVAAAAAADLKAAGYVAKPQAAKKSAS
jgi:hypothetical protein